MALLERAGRGVRLTDAALVLVRHAHALLDRAELAEAELAAAAGSVVGRGRIAAFQSVALRLASPAMHALAREAPGLRCELVEAEPEQSLPALALGDFDLVLADEWQHQPHSRPAGVDRHDLHRDPVRLVLPEGHPIARRHPLAVPLPELADEVWTTGHRGTGWEEMTDRTCRQLGGFDPDIRHRTNDSVVSLGLVAQGLAVTLLPDLARPATIPASSCARSPRAPCTGPSSPRPARRTPGAPPSGRCSPRSAPPRRASAGRSSARLDPVLRFDLLDDCQLRLLEEADRDEFYELVDANRDYLARWMPWAAGQTREGTLEFIRLTRRQIANNDGFQTAIVRGGRIIGIVGFHGVDWAERSTSIGYWLDEQQQGRGIMTGAVRALVDQALLGWRLNRVEIRAATENRRSRAIPERLGFRERARRARRSGSASAISTQSSTACSPRRGRRLEAGRNR